MSRAFPRMSCSIVILLLAFSSAQSQEKRLAPRMLPGDGVLDPAGKVGFFPNPTGGIDAINMTSGAVLWSSKDANRPLFATEKRVYALKGKGNSMRVVGLDSGPDAGKNRRVFESPAISLPEWASMDVEHGKSFQVGSRLGQDGLLVIWEARAFYAGGAAPPPEVLEQSRKEAKGVARIDVETGKATILDAKQVAAGKFIPLEVQMMLIVGDYTFREADESANNPKNPQQQRRFLEAVNASMEVVWRREIAAPVVLLPRP